jgi:hypothetical protein
MKKVILLVAAVLATASVAQAKNQVYGVEGRGMEDQGYKLFISDKIVNTVAKTVDGKPMSGDYCRNADKEATKNLGDVTALRADKRLSLPADANVSYSAACSTFNAVVDGLKTADDIRKLWLLFGDSATDDYVQDTLKNKGPNEDVNNEVRLLIETKRLAIVSKYIDFFTKNQDWKLTEYTFLSQAFKARKTKSLSPDFIQFIDSLLKGDAEKGVRIVQSIDLDNLGERFLPPGTSEQKK